MVSTRGVKSKFAVGEKVLCYEPDPTKARVLYDSKVLKVIVKTDKDGRKAVEYLIHFQGWNSSWDRYVTEDFVLKHTDENWRLQRKLAEKVQLHPGAYLYHRDHKESKLVKEKALSYQRDIQHNFIASPASWESSVSNRSINSVDTESSEQCKRRSAHNKRKMGKESVMADKHIHTSCESNSTKLVCSVITEDGHHNDSGAGENGVQYDDRYEANVFDEDNRNDELDSELFGDNVKNGGISPHKRSSRHDRSNYMTQSENGILGYLEENNFSLEISDILKEILELDNELIKSGKKLVRLPASPNVVTILESYVREYTINQVCGTPEKPHCRNKPHPCHQNNSLDLEQINRSVSICREVADGVRVYFDFTLSGLLLYNEEQEQYEQCNQMIDCKDICSNSRFGTATEKKDNANGKFSPVDYSLLREPNSSLTNRDNIMQPDHRTVSIGKEYTRIRHTSSEGRGCNSVNEDIRNKEADNCIVTDVPSKAACHAFMSKEEHDDTIHDKLSSITSNSSIYWSLSEKTNIPSVKEALNARDCSFNLSEFPVPHILDWHLVPESLYGSKPVLPSLVYGAVHLTRLFVKLPGLLLNADIPAKKLKIVLQHLQMILRYMEMNKSWFGENVYQDSLVGERPK